eukprot:CAMPEP_0118881132 /NCGR_PEP_ID=MMETSP1163-20130328/20626_1 /TAXON_ID=124430 /ORGANISM="Phaeomonas parva, Strain CCMP2877" /LENGTH=162 /DNA_ID=CAMNT_0006817795 /DNA_START=239 /DNA_END=727 /DNA_ORIENTATION=+
MAELINANPTVYATAGPARLELSAADVAFDDEDEREPVTAEEVFDMVRQIRDPEHEALTLEQLRVVTLENVDIDDAAAALEMRFTPTVPHCSMATLIGLCLRVKLLRSLPRRFKVRVMVTPGAHASEEEVNRQLNDKERVAAALENAHLLQVVTKSIKDTDP